MLLTRAPLEYPPKGLSVRLACLRHAASVRSEPGSNSPIETWHSIANAPSVEDRDANRIELFGSEWEIVRSQGRPSSLPRLDGPHAIRFSKTEGDFGRCLFRSTRSPKTRRGGPKSHPWKPGGSVYAGCRGPVKPSNHASFRPARRRSRRRGRHGLRSSERRAARIAASRPVSDRNRAPGSARRRRRAGRRGSRRAGTTSRRASLRDCASPERLQDLEQAAPPPSPSGEPRLRHVVGHLLSLDHALGSAPARLARACVAVKSRDDPRSRARA